MIGCWMFADVGDEWECHSINILPLFVPIAEFGVFFQALAIAWPQKRRVPPILFS